MKTYRQMLDELYEKALKDNDTYCAIEVADRINNLPVVEVSHNLMLEAFDQLIYNSENDILTDDVFKCVHGGRTFVIKLKE